MENERARIIESLEKLVQRKDFKSPSQLPSFNCSDVTTHLCGIYLKTHARVILEALRRMD